MACAGMCWHVLCYGDIPAWDLAAACDESHEACQTLVQRWKAETLQDSCQKGPFVKEKGTPSSMLGIGNVAL